MLLINEIKRASKVYLIIAIFATLDHLVISRDSLFAQEKGLYTASSAMQYTVLFYHTYYSRSKLTDKSSIILTIYKLT